MVPPVWLMSSPAVRLIRPVPAWVMLAATVRLSPAAALLPAISESLSASVSAALTVSGLLARIVEPPPLPVELAPTMVSGPVLVMLVLPVVLVNATWVSCDSSASADPMPPAAVRVR